MRKLKLGVLNIMPNAATYLKAIRRSLVQINDLFDLYPIRLTTHRYKSSMQDVKDYYYFDDIMTSNPLDLLIITGAPVEHLPYEEIKYWGELRDVLNTAQTCITSVLGICFGGLAIGKFLGLEKRVVREKLFGVYTVAMSDASARCCSNAATSFSLPMSTWAVLDERHSMQNEGRALKILAYHPDIGPAILSTDDDQFVMILGHPEYSADNLYKEWLRDSEKDVAYVRNFNDASFAAMGRKLEHNACPLLANWIRSYAGDADGGSADTLEIAL